MLAPVRRFRPSRKKKEQEMNAKRRLTACLSLAFAMCALANAAPDANTEAEAVALTKGPGFHWFGYYDKFQFDPTDRYVLGMRVDFEHRLPTDEDVVKVGMIDLADGNKWIELGESRAWCWQQGCMLQWRPGSDREVVWNDREEDKFVCRIIDVKTLEMRTLPRAVGTISPDGETALCEDFSRVWNFRSGYGYAGISDPYAEQPAPTQVGVWRMNMNTGETRKLVSVADLVEIPYPGQTPNDRHYVNHLAWSPDGERFLMFNRWSGGGQPTRVFTMAADGSALRLLSARNLAGSLSCSHLGQRRLPALQRRRLGIAEVASLEPPERSSDICSRH